SFAYGTAGTTSAVMTHLARAARRMAPGGLVAHLTRATCYRNTNIVFATLTTAARTYTHAILTTLACSALHAAGATVAGVGAYTLSIAANLIGTTALIAVL